MRNTLGPPGLRTMIVVEFTHLFSEHIDEIKDDERDGADWTEDAVVKAPADFSETERDAKYGKAKNHFRGRCHKLRRSDRAAMTTPLRVFWQLTVY
jgi:hypothetical protein